MKPEILTHPNIPKPLHGIAPRVIYGDKWWDVERKKCYEVAEQKCEACGTPRQQAWPNRWLEAHEEYTIDGAISTFVGLVCLCPACHKFIHSGLRSVLVTSRRMSVMTDAKIQAHGETILEENGLYMAWLNRHHQSKSYQWSDYKMVIGGVAYGPSSKCYNDWQAGNWRNWKPPQKNKEGLIL